MCKTQKHFAGICTHEEIMQMLEYRNKSDSYLKRIDPEFPPSLSRAPFQRKKHYYALKEVYPYVQKINDHFREKDRLKAETARQTLERFRSNQPWQVIMALRRISAVHEDFRELESILSSVSLPVRHRSKHRDACLTAIKFYMQRQTGQARLRVVQKVLNWIDHEEQIRDSARM